MRGHFKPLSLLMLIIALVFAAALSETAPEPALALPIPLDESGFIDLNRLDVRIGTTNADAVSVYSQPGGDAVTVIPNTGTVVCVLASGDSLESPWYPVTVESDAYVYGGYIESGALTVSPVTDAENMFGSEAFALALNKLYDVSAIEPDQLPEGLYDIIIAARPVYLSKTGTKYHYNPACSNMKNPRETTLARALDASKE
ncbi:MAG: hypothetical protein LBB86_08855, partial [Oscillospiraceae bacterium]|nr:hypothetical protein [Oscillospiraceae bacterium]